MFVCRHTPFVLTPFKTPVQIDSFQDPRFVYNTKLFKLTPFRPQHPPWETTFKLTVLNLHGGLPSTKLVISRQFYTVNPGLISRPLHHFDSVLILHGRLPWKNLILSGPSYTVNFGFLSRPLWLIHYIQCTDSFQDHLEEEKKNTQQYTQQYSFSDFLDSFQDPTSEIKEDRGHRTTQQIIHHHHRTIEGT